MTKNRESHTHKTRIQSQNEALILDAALEVFSVHGFRGTTVDQIAGRCGMSKPNLLYYFRKKDDIYRAVLERTLALWLAPLENLNAEGDPLAELSRYISAKLSMTFDDPKSSKLFANEILHGAPHVAPFLSGPLKSLVDKKATVIEKWVHDGKLAPIDPHHLIFAIWSVTQHYADFGIQVEAVLGQKADKAQIIRAVETILLRGLKVN